MGKKTAFFDMDGTIVAPRFPSKQKYVCGFPSEQWKEFCDSKDEDAYDECKPIMEVMQYARCLAKAGWDCIVLTVTLSQGEQHAKTHWLQNHNEFDSFVSIQFCKNDDEKFEFIEQYAKSHNIPLTDCMIVEDNYYNILKAIEKGIRAMHISHIITRCYDAANLPAERYHRDDFISFRQWYESNKGIVKMIRVRVEIRKDNGDTGSRVMGAQNLLIDDAIDLFGDLQISRLDCVCNDRTADFEVTLMKR